jgi:hypothetical protein
MFLRPLEIEGLVPAMKASAIWRMISSANLPPIKRSQQIQAGRANMAVLRFSKM